jgi:hypothetical protein
VRIQFAVDGGIAYMPVLAAPVTIDTAALAPEQATAVEQLVDRARFFTLPPRIGQLSRGAADHQTYTLSIEDGGRSHTVHITDLAAHPELAALVRALQRQVKGLRRVNPDAK